MSENTKTYTQSDLEQENQVVKTMIGIYCKGNKHSREKGHLCESCQALLDYAKKRSEKCPRKGEKTFCNTCPIHCYKPEYRAKVKEVMKYAGPRMLYTHPIITMKHTINTCKHKMEQKSK